MDPRSVMTHNGAEMQKVADIADISVLLFSKAVLMQTGKGTGMVAVVCLIPLKTTIFLFLDLVNFYCYQLLPANMAK